MLDRESPTLSFMEKCETLEELAQSKVAPLQKVKCFNEVATQYSFLDRNDPDHLKATRKFIRILSRFNAPCSGGSGVFHCFTCASNKECAKSLAS